MSLLNQMLSDLEQRRAEAGGLPTPHREVRPLPAAPRRLPGALIGLALAAGGLITAAVVWRQSAPSKPAPLPPALVSAAASAALPDLSMPAPSAPVLPEPGAVAQQESPALPTPTPTPTPGSSKRSTAAISGAVGGLRLSEQLSLGQNEPVAVVAEVNEPGAAPAGVASLPVEASPSIEKRAREASPREQAERLYRSALNQFAQGRDADGGATLNAALKTDPGHVAARQLLIRRQLEQQAPDAAQVTLEAGLQRHPEQTGWAMLLSRLLIDRGDLAGALAVLERHQHHAPASADYRAAIAAVQQRMNAYGEAELNFLRATQLDPGNGRWWIGLGMVRESQNRHLEARDAYQNALRTGSLNADLKAFSEAKLR